MSKRQEYFGRRDPHEVIRPTQHRHRPPKPKTPRDEVAELNLALGFRSTLMSHQLGVEILAKCGLHPIDDAQREARETLREMQKSKKGFENVPESAMAVQDEAFKTLLDWTSCTHCEARSECRAHRRLSQS